MDDQDVLPIVGEKYFKDGSRSSFLEVRRIEKEQVYTVLSVLTKDGYVRVDQYPKLTVWKLHEWREYHPDLAFPFVQEKNYG